MPTRQDDVVPSPAERLLRLRGWLEELLPGLDAPNSPLRQVLGDPAVILRAVPLVARAVRAVLRRPGRAQAAPVRRGGSVRGRPAWRRPLALAAVAAVLAAAWLTARSTHRLAARV